MAPARGVPPDNLGALIYSCGFVLGRLVLCWLCLSLIAVLRNIKPKMSVPADPLPVALTADGKKSLDTAQKPGFVDSSSKLSADSLPASEVELKANPFLDPVVAETYRQIYNEAGYECREAFDPDLQWTQEEEKKLKRKLDLHVAFWACVMFFALNVDRGNLKQAIADNLLDDLGLTTNDYNTGEHMELSLEYTRMLLTMFRKYHLLPLIFGGRIAISIDLEEDRSR